MKSPTHAEQREPAEELSLYCSPMGDAWRVHVRPAWVPRYLQPYFDTHGEAYPVYIDFEDLARHMESNAAHFEKRVNRAGGVELLAREGAAESLGVWLSTAFSSGVRPGTR
jgi:hypothetical protein